MARLDPEGRLDRDCPQGTHSPLSGILGQHRAELRVGRSGRLLFWRGLYTLAGDLAHLQFAVDVLDDVLARAVLNELGMRWHNIEHSARPPPLPAQTGWMRGAAGMGAARLRPPGLRTGSGTGRWLPTRPFAKTEPAVSAA